MKIACIEKKNQLQVCVVREKDVLLLQDAYQYFKKRLSPHPALPFHVFMHPPHFIENFSRIRKIMKEVLSLAEKSFGKNEYTVPLSKAKLKAPIPKPGAIYCLARNYADHILEFQERVMEQDKMVPPIFIKPQTCVTGPGGPVVLPKVGRQIDWEAELAVVIGKRAKYVSPERALSHVFGYTCMLDISERGLRIRNRTEDRGRDKFFDWLNGKWMDTFAPQGPWITTRDEIPDPQDLSVTLSVNGAQKQNGQTAQMIFPVAEIISYLSHLVTLLPGDIISTGTPAGVGASKEDFLKDGDHVEMAIQGVGTLAVKVRRES